MVMVVMLVVLPAAGGLRLRRGSKEAEGGYDQCCDEQFFHGFSGVFGIWPALAGIGVNGRDTGQQQKVTGAGAIFPLRIGLAL